MLVEMKEISQMHAAEKISTDTHSTLHTDGTTKFGHKHSGYQVTTADGTFSLGISELDAGSPARALEVMKDLLVDVEKACSSSGVVKVAAHQIVRNIKNTMSDRGSVEKVFNNLFDTYRGSLLPGVVEDWGSLSTEAKESMASVNHFYCGLHYLVGLAEQSEAVLVEWEKNHFDGKPVGAAASLPFTKKGESAGTDGM